jgi:hypothetical protein
MTSRLCGNGGSFFICSGDTGLLLAQAQKEYIKTDFTGTVVCLELNTSNIGVLQATLIRFSKEGAEIARQYGDEQQITATTASRLVSRDFRPIDDTEIAS